MMIAAAGFSPPAHAFVFRLSVTNKPASGPIASNFLGVAVEFDEIPWLAGSSPQSVDPVFVQLMHNLDPQGRPVLRIGGLSTERTWWPVPGWQRPLGLTYNLSPSWMADARSLAQATNAQLMPGVNLESGRLHIAQVEAAQFVKYLGAQYLHSLEIGNEPELYTSIPWYRVVRGAPVPWYSPTGTPVFNRRPGYGPTQFAGEFGRTLKLMPPGVPISGPVTGNPPWLQAFSPFISRSSRVRTVTWHAYGLNECVTDPTSPQYPSVPNLLSVNASRSFINGLSGFVNQAHRAGAGFRVDEMGSVTCNGRLGVSNAMASALWVMDALFSMVANGVDGVNLHTYPGTTNALFDFQRTQGRWLGFVHPLYYGALMFTQAAPAGSRLLQISSGNQNQLRAWATIAPDRRVRILLINDALRSSAQTIVRVPGAVGSAAVERLGAPGGAFATNGITLGGATFGADTLTGVLPAPQPQAVTSRAGTYTVVVPPSGAALLTLPPGRAG
jgi:glycosyl hydrolase family 79